MTHISQWHAPLSQMRIEKKKLDQEPSTGNRMSVEDRNYRIMAQATFEGIAMTEQGIIKDCNDQLATMLGYVRGELLGRPALDFVAPESRDFVRQAHRRGLEQPYEHVALRKDGTTFTVEVRGKYITEEGHQLRVATIRDITQRKQLEQSLERERNLLRALIDNLPDLIYFKDAEGRYILNNRAHLHSMGAERQEDVLGKTTFDFHPEDLAQRYHEDERRIVSTGIPMTGIEELALHRDTGEQRWHLTTKIPIRNSRGEVIGVTGISRDITEQRELREQRDRYVQELQDALEKVTTLSGLLPICAGCKKIRDDKGYWQQVEGYIMEHSSARFTHGLCPDCLEKMYSEFQKDA